MEHGFRVNHGINAIIMALINSGQCSINRCLSFFLCLPLTCDHRSARCQRRCASPLPLSPSFPLALCLEGASLTATSCATCLRPLLHACVPWNPSPKRCNNIFTRSRTHLSVADEPLSRAPRGWGCRTPGAEPMRSPHTRRVKR
jgi:hypothetical protein